MLGFDENGLLPVGVHDCDEGEFRTLLVDSFPDSATRGVIAAGFARLRIDACDHALAGMHWIDGSYVTNKQNPNDIDVVTFVDVDLLESLLGSPGEQFVIQVLAGGPATPAVYRSDSYVVAVAPPDHPEHHRFVKARDYWRKWFGHMRTVGGPDGALLPARPKGILQMQLGDPLKQPQIESWGDITNG